MKIGVIGISGKGKSTFLNHLIDEEISIKLNDLIGPRNKEAKSSGQTKNPVRYLINKDLEVPLFKVSKLENDAVNEYPIELSQVAHFAQSLEKCTVILNVKPSTHFEKVMDNFNLTELEFIDTQGLLDSLNDEIPVPYEIKQCSVLLYLYHSSDILNRKDFTDKYRNFLNSISEKPMIFLETDTQWQISKSELNNLSEIAHEKLQELDLDFSVSADEIRDRYSILTNNDAYNNNDTFILNSILSASESSVNYYEIKIPNGYDDSFDLCLNLCSSHAMNQVFSRLATLKISIELEFNKAKGDFEHSVCFKSCYGLLDDVFIYQYQRINYNTTAYVLRFARNNFNRFKNALAALHEGKLFNVDLSKNEYEIHTEYGFHFIYETYQNQDLLDCMQLLLDLYKSYLKNISISGNKLSKAVQVYLANSISNDFICRDTGYNIPILKEDVFVKVMQDLQEWIGDLPVENVVYVDYDKFDIDYYQKDNISMETGGYISNTRSLITKLDYSCMSINNRMYNLASKAILESTNEFLEI